MVTKALRPHRRWELVSFFLIALVASLVIFTISNNREHDRVRADARASCLKDKQIAANQRGVIVALLYLARAEGRERGEHHLPIAVQRAEEALANVPQFNCK